MLVNKSQKRDMVLPLKEKIKGIEKDVRLPSAKHDKVLFPITHNEYEAKHPKKILQKTA